MRRDGEALIPNLAPLFKNRSQTFFFKATNGRWRGVLAEADLALYEAKVRAMLSPDCARWVAGGREQPWDQANTTGRMTRNNRITAPRNRRTTGSKGNAGLGAREQ